MKLDNIILGRTRVKVMKHEDSKNPYEIHRGVIVQDLGSFVRVFNPEPPDKGGDRDPLCSEVFAVKSPSISVEVLGELKETQAIRIPVQFN